CRFVSARDLRLNSLSKPKRPVFQSEQFAVYFPCQYSARIPSPTEDPPALARPPPKLGIQSHKAPPKCRGRARRSDRSAAAGATICRQFLAKGLAECDPREQGSSRGQSASMRRALPAEGNGRTLSALPNGAPCSRARARHREADQGNG